MRNKVHEINHPSGITYTVQHVKLYEYEEVLNEFNGQELPEYENKSISQKVFLLNDGRVLCVAYPTATIYSSFDGFRSNGRFFNLPGQVQTILDPENID